MGYRKSKETTTLAHRASIFLFLFQPTFVHLQAQSPTTPTTACDTFFSSENRSITLWNSSPNENSLISHNATSTLPRSLLNATWQGTGHEASNETTCLKARGARGAPVRSLILLLTLSSLHYPPLPSSPTLISNDNSLRRLLHC